MDKFVVRPKTWKKMTHATMAKKKIAIASNTIEKQITSKNTKPLAEKQLSSIHNSAHRNSSLDSFLTQTVLTSTPLTHQRSQSDDLLDVPTISELENNPTAFVTLRKRQPNGGDVNDYVTPDQANARDTIKIRQASPKSIPFLSNKVQFDDLGERLRTNQHTTSRATKSKLFSNPTHTEPITPKKQSNAALMSRIQRDLNSPSATLRLRALRALQDPKNAEEYTRFDIPHEEQPIITAEELRSPPPKPSIKDVMRDVVVYAEVRSGEDNRTAGIKKVISALGARVNDRLLRDTTHVVFKDGRLSTYKKAKQWNIPIVSILWVEECKKQCKLCDPKDFPISDIERYEYPELYEKMKRHKSMQPESECNKRVRMRNGGTPKETASTPKSTKPTNSHRTKSGTTPSLSGNKKTEISQYFNPIRKSQTIHDEHNNDDDNGPMAETSPLGKLLKIMNKKVGECLAKKQSTYKGNCAQSIDTSNDDESDDDGRHNTEQPQANALNEEPKPESNQKPRLSSRRSHSQATAHNRNHALIKEEARSTHSNDSSRRVNRRATIHVSAQSTTNLMTKLPKRIETIDLFDDLPAPVVVASTILVAPSGGCVDDTGAGTGPGAAAEGGGKVDETKKSPTPKRRRRRTTFSNLTMDISAKTNNRITDINQRRVNARRTLYTPRKIEEDSDETIPILAVTPNESLFPNGSACTPTPQTTATLTDLPASAIVFSSTRKPGNRRTLFDLSIDMITQRLQTINKSARRSTAARHVISEPDLQHDSQLVKNNDTPKRSRSTIRVNEANTCRELFSEQSQATEKANEVSATAQNLSNGATSTTTIKKRKLYVPENNVNQVDKQPAADNANCNDPDGDDSDEKKRKESANRLTEISGDVSMPTVQTFPTKKRRLYAPENFDNTTTAASISSSTMASRSSTSGGRRSLMPIATNRAAYCEPKNDEQTLPEITTTATAAALAATLTEAAAAASSKSSNVAKSSSSSKGAESKSSKQRISADSNKPNTNTKGNNLQRISGGETTATAAPAVRPNEANPKKIPFLVYTNMHAPQVNVIREVVSKLGVFCLEDEVSCRTTHIVSFEPRRTLNLLRGLIRGLWILDYKWILASRDAKRWLPEEPYELKDFSRAVEICRAERQAFGRHYRCELFTGIGSFFISARCGPVSKEDLTELIEMCGGKVTENRKRAKYILGNANRVVEEKTYVTPFWILDSITQMQLMRCQAYTPHWTIAQRINQRVMHSLPPIQCTDHIIKHTS